RDTLVLNRRDHRLGEFGIRPALLQCFLGGIFPDLLRVDRPKLLEERISIFISVLFRSLLFRSLLLARKFRIIPGNSRNPWKQRPRALVKAGLMPLEVDDLDVA